MKSPAMLAVAATLTLGQLISADDVLGEILLTNVIDNATYRLNMISVDVPPAGPSADDVCEQVGFEAFVEVTGADTPGGIYGIEVYEQGVTDCEGTVLLADSLSVAEDETAWIVLQHDAQAVATFEKYTVDDSPLDNDDEFRVNFIHAASLPPLDINLVDTDENNTRIAEFPTIVNGEQTYAFVGSPETHTYRINVKDARTGVRIFREHRAFNNATNTAFIHGNANNIGILLSLGFE